MNKINVTIDLTKIDKSKIVTRTYKNKSGEDVTVKEYTMDVVPLKSPELVKIGDGWNLMKTHFVAEGQTKEERLAKKKTVYIGKGVQFETNTTERVEYPPENRVNSDGSQTPDF